MHVHQTSPAALLPMRMLCLCCGHAVWTHSRRAAAETAPVHALSGPSKLGERSSSQPCSMQPCSTQPCSAWLVVPQYPRCRPAASLLSAPCMQGHPGALPAAPGHGRAGPGRRRRLQQSRARQQHARAAPDPAGRGGWLLLLLHFRVDAPAPGLCPWHCILRMRPVPKGMEHTLSAELGASTSRSLPQTCCQ